MKKNITFRHMDSSEALKNHAYEKLRKLEKYENQASEAHIVLSIEGHRHQAEINFSAKQYKASVSSESKDMYISIDDAVSKLEQSIKKHNDKIRT